MHHVELVTKQEGWQIMNKCQLLTINIFPEGIAAVMCD